MSESIDRMVKEIELLLREEQLDKAHKQIQELLYSAPHAPSTWKLEAMYRLQTEAWEAAEFAIGQARQLAPFASWTLVLWAQYCIASERLEEALESLHEAMSMAETFEEQKEVNILHAQTVLRFNAEQENTDDDWEMESDFPIEEEIIEAVRAIKNVLEEEPKNKVAAVLKAKLAEAQDRETEALTAWEYAVDLDPDDLDTMYGLARTLESMEYNEEAYELYSTIYERELALYESEGTDTSIFSSTTFTEAAHEAWQECQEQWALTDQPFHFDFQTESYPARQTMEESSPESLFDPRVGLHVAFTDIFEETPTIQMVMYQRNIERDLEGDDPVSLRLAIHDLLEKYIDRIFDVLEQDEEEDW